MEFIQTAGVAEGAEGSCLPAAPTLHPHRGTARPSLPPTWLPALGRRRTHGNEERAAQGTSLLQCHTCHHPSPAHAGSRALRLHHQSSLIPACTTEQPLTPSLPEKPPLLAQSRAWRTAPAAQHCTLGSVTLLLDTQPQTHRDAGFLGGMGRFGSLSL